jgi:hypothetical protein
LKGTSTISPTKTVPRPNPARAQAPSVPGEERQVVRDTTWYFYDRLTDALGDHSPFRIALDGNEMEIVMPGFTHDHLKILLSLFIDFVSFGRKINCQNLGSTTMALPQSDHLDRSDCCRRNLRHDGIQQVPVCSGPRSYAMGGRRRCIRSLGLEKVTGGTHADRTETSSRSGRPALNGRSLELGQSAFVYAPIENEEIPWPVSELPA